MHGLSPQDIAIDFGKAKTGGVTIKEDSFDHLSITLQFEGITSFHVSTVKGGILMRSAFPDYTQSAD